MDRYEEMQKKMRERLSRLPEEREETEHERLLREDPEYRWYKESNPWRSEPAGTFGLFRIQSLLSLVIFALVWAMFQWNHPSLVQGQSFVRTALTEELQWHNVYAWYRDRFGDISLMIPTLQRDKGQAERVHADYSRNYIAPVAGTIVEPFGGVRSGAGVVIRTSTNTVSSIDTGLVLYAGGTADSGQMVVIRHPDGIETVYGFLSEVHVKENDWVEAGDVIGLVQPSVSASAGGLVYFAVKKGNSYVDPTDVLAL